MFISLIERPADVDIERPIIIDTRDEGWGDSALDLLLADEDIVVDSCLIRASTFHPGRPLWPQLRRRLRELGLPVPALSD